MNILVIVGSLRQKSIHSQLAKEALAFLNPEIEVTYLDYADTPLMNQDIEFPTPEPISRIRQEIAAADLIWIFSPVYNHAIPGPVKNLLDWMSRSLDEKDSRGKSILYDKLITVSSVASGKAALDMMAQYEALLPFIKMQLLPSFAETINKSAHTTGLLELTVEQKAGLKEQAQRMEEALTTLG